MRQLPRLPEGLSAEQKIEVIYDWLYELQMEFLKGEKNDEASESNV